jgi:hypothetical protein
MLKGTGMSERSTIPSNRIMTRHEEHVLTQVTEELDGWLYSPVIVIVGKQRMSEEEL